MNLKTLQASLVAAVILGGSALQAPGQVVRVGDLNTTQIRSLDRATTAVILQGGFLEEHGPYLPAFTDGFLSERLTQEVAQAIVAKRPGFKALVFPQIALGSSGSNEIGGHFVFPGTYAVRASTLRSVFMDLATELGEQGFKWIFIINVHGAPLHNRALDDASDYFHETYGGRMVHLWGMIPVLGGWGTALGSLTPAQKKEEGVSLHAGMDETSLMLYLKPELVSPGYKTAPRVTGDTTAESFAITKSADWPGYLGSPRLATIAFGKTIWTSFANAAVEHTLKILDGVDPLSFPRYSDYLEKSAPHRTWIDAATSENERRGTKQRDWLTKRDRTPPR